MTGPSEHTHDEIKVVPTTLVQKLTVVALVVCAAYSLYRAWLDAKQPSVVEALEDMRIQQLVQDRRTQLIVRQEIMHFLTPAAKEEALGNEAEPDEVKVL